MLTTEQIQNEALRLHNSEKKRQQVKATTLSYPDMDVDDAYAIQNAWMQIKKEEGREVAGYKIGLTSRTMQKAMGIDEPDYGMLLDDMVFENGADIQVNNFLDPRIEVELAFFLKSPLSGSNLSVQDVLNATDYISPALELIAARSFRVDPETGYVRTVRDTISDNAANGGVIVGDHRISPGDADLRWVGAMMSKNDIIEESGVSGAVLNHPANGISWLAKKYDQHGISLLPGQIILAGSFTRPVKIQEGDNMVVDFNQFGKIELTFS